jgi:hypothetical protein
MPIPQSRVIDLLSAALDYKQAFDGLNHRIKNFAQETNNHQLEALTRYSADECLTDPIKTNITITLEEKRISLTRRYNETRRNKPKKPIEIPSIEQEYNNEE